MVVALVALFAMGAWIEYEELYNNYGGPLAENSPPNAAVGVICALLVICAILYKLRHSLRLVAAELVVIYAALVLAAPLMTQGMWHRLFGLVAAVPHNSDFKTYQSLPSVLWPHGQNLCANGEFRHQLDDFKQTGDGTVTWTNVTVKAGEVRPSPVLANGSDPAARVTLQWTANRYDAAGREVLVPGESFLFSLLAQAEGFTKGSSYFVKVQADDGPVPLPLLLGRGHLPALADRGVHRSGEDLHVPPVAQFQDIGDVRQALPPEGGIVVRQVPRGPEGPADGRPQPRLREGGRDAAAPEVGRVLHRYLKHVETHPRRPPDQPG